MKTYQINENELAGREAVEVGYKVVINEDGTKNYVETEEYNEPINEEAEVIESEATEQSAHDALFEN